MKIKYKNISEGFFKSTEQIANARKSRTKNDAMIDVANIVKKLAYKKYIDFIINEPAFSIVLTPIYYILLRPLTLSRKFDRQTLISGKHKEYPFTITDVEIINLDVSSGTLYLNLCGLYGIRNKDGNLQNLSRYLQVGYSTSLEKYKKEANKRVSGVFRKLSKNYTDETTQNYFNLIKNIVIEKVYMYKNITEEWGRKNLSSIIFLPGVFEKQNKSFRNSNNILNTGKGCCDTINISDIQDVYAPIFSYFDFSKTGISVPIRDININPKEQSVCEYRTKIVARKNITNYYPLALTAIHNKHLADWQIGKAKEWIDDKDNIEIYVEQTYEVEYYLKLDGTLGAIAYIQGIRPDDMEVSIIHNHKIKNSDNIRYFDKYNDYMTIEPFEIDNFFDSINDSRPTIELWNELTKIVEEQSLIK